MSDLQSRRNLLRTIGAALAAQGALSAQQAEHVHQAVMQTKTAGRYQPKALNAHEYGTLQRLADLILPADERSPGALQAGAADFIDFLCAASDDLKDIYTGGLAWIDAETRRRSDGKEFITASPANQTALLDLIAWRKS